MFDVDKNEYIENYSDKIVELLEKFYKHKNMSINPEFLHDVFELTNESIKYNLSQASVTSTSFVDFLLNSIQLSQNQTLLQKETKDGHIEKMKGIVDNDKTLSKISEIAKTNYYDCKRKISDYLPYLDMYFSRGMKFTLTNHEKKCLYDSTNKTETQENVSLLSHSNGESIKHNTGR